MTDTNARSRLAVLIHEDIFQILNGEHILLRAMAALSHFGLLKIAAREQKHALISSFIYHRCGGKFFHFKAKRATDGTTLGGH